MPSILPDHSFTRVLRRIIDVFTLMCGWWLIGLSFLTCVEVIGRKFFGYSLQGVDEIGSYTFAIVGAVGFSFALITRAHVRVDFLLSRFGRKAQAWINVTAIVTLAAMSIFFAYRAFEVVLESTALRSAAATPLATPLWIPQSIWLTAYFIFAVTAVVAAGYAGVLLVRGAWEDINQRFGPLTLKEEIESESIVRLPQQASSEGDAR